MNEQPRTEFNKRTKVLNLSEEAKEELLLKFQACYNNGFLCLYCDKRMELKWGSELSFTIDHIISRRFQGEDSINNLAFVCRSCNYLKGSMSVVKYLKNMDRLKQRKNKREFFKAKSASKKDKATREAYQDIFNHLEAKKQ